MSRKMRKKSRSGGSETWRVVLRIIRSAKPIRWWLALACLLAVVVITCALAGPTLLGDLIQVLYDCWAGLRSPAAWRPPWCRGSWPCWGSTPSRACSPT